MSLNLNCRLVYDKLHNIQVMNEVNELEARNLNINLLDNCDFLQLKMKDPNDLLFNYTINIDCNYFNYMKNEQNLDINFNEFKMNLLELLQMNIKQEMHLKCELINNKKCKLIFYEKSKIKSIIFLYIDLNQTCQKDIFNEINKNLNDLKYLNHSLNMELKDTKKALTDHQMALQDLKHTSNGFKSHFLEGLKDVELHFTEEIQKTCLKITRKLDFNLEKVRNLKENLRKLTLINKSLRGINEGLTKENLGLKNDLIKLNEENNYLKLNRLEMETYKKKLENDLKEKLEIINDLKLNQINQLDNDLKKSMVLLKQKSDINDELAKDLLQANQMLVNFNNTIDEKNLQINKLNDLNKCNEKFLNENLNKYQLLLNEFNNYKLTFNSNDFHKLKNDLLLANKKIENVEKLNRETVKLNELLTRKLAAGNFNVRQQFN